MTEVNISKPKVEGASSQQIHWLLGTASTWLQYCWTRAYFSRFVICFICKPPYVLRIFTMFVFFILYRMWHGQCVVTLHNMRIYDFLGLFGMCSLTWQLHYDQQAIGLHEERQQKFLFSASSAYRNDLILVMKTNTLLQQRQMYGLYPVSHLTHRNMVNLKMTTLLQLLSIWHKVCELHISQCHPLWRRIIILSYLYLFIDCDST